MTAFRSEGELRAWLAASGFEFGAIASPQTAYDLGREWYATRLDPTWERPTAVAAQAIFARHGLSGEFWSLA